MNPFAQAVGQAPAPVAGFALGSNPLDGIEHAKMPGASKPKLEENHDYVVDVTGYVLNKGTFFVECTVCESNGGSPVGFETSISQSTKSDFWEGYFKKIVLANLGVNPDNAAECAPALPFIKPCLEEALTKGANPALPVHLVGRKMRVRVVPGKPPAPGKKYYPVEYCSPY